MKGKDFFHASSFFLSLCSHEKGKETLLDSNPEKPELVHSEQMFNPPLQGTNLVLQPGAMASDLQVLTLIPTSSQPPGTRSSVQITVQ